MAAQRRRVRWRPKLVALDIDGTLVSHRGVVPAEVHSAVRMVVDSGTPLVLATGRSWHGTQPIVEQLQLPHGHTVVSNGAAVVKHSPMVIEHRFTFDPATVIEKVQRWAPGALIAVEDIEHGYRLSGLFPPGDLSGEMLLQSAEQLAAFPTTRVVVRDPEGSHDLCGLAQQLESVRASWSAGWLKIAPEGIDKSSALALVAASYAVNPDEVLAIGDGRNDIEMLAWAGRGVALGQGPMEVKAAADHVTQTFAEGGTVAELKRWFPVGRKYA